MVFHEKLSRLLGGEWGAKARLAKGTEIDQSYVSKLAKGTEKPTEEQVFKIAKYFNVSADWLYYEDFDWPPMSENDLSFQEKKIISLYRSLYLDFDEVWDMLASLAKRKRPSSHDYSQGDPPDPPPPEHTPNRRSG